MLDGYTNTNTDTDTNTNTNGNGNGNRNKNRNGNRNRNRKQKVKQTEPNMFGNVRVTGIVLSCTKCIEHRQLVTGLQHYSITGVLDY